MDFVMKSALANTLKMQSVLSMNGELSTLLSVTSVVLFVLLVFVILYLFNRQKTLNRFKEMVYDDDLTRLKNIVYLREHFNNLIVSFDKDVTLFHLSIDNFKNHNDLLGRQLADLLLVELAERIKKLIKPFETIYRNHSDFFIFMYPTIADQDGSFSKKILKVLKEPYIFNIHSVVLTVSIGAYEIGAKNPRFNDCLLHSELALQFAKDNGKDQIVYYSDHIKKRNQESYATFRMIKEALKENRFFLEFQPIVDAKTFQVIGLESLLRLRYLDRIYFPQDIVNYAEKYHLIEDIDRFVVKESFSALKRLEVVYPKLSFISLNISSKEIMNKLFLDYAIEQAKIQDIKPSKITFEFTETYKSEDFEKEAVFIKYLQKNGFKVAIDDFGSGYSSMIRLSLNNFDKIKIDRSLITGISTNLSNQKIVQAIIGLSHTFNLEIIVEGIETDEDVDYFKDIDIKCFQGFRFYQSLEESTCLELLSRLRKDS